MLSRAAFQLHGHGMRNSIADGDPGFVSDEYLNTITAETSITAAELCAASLWVRVDGGYEVMDDAMIEMTLNAHIQVRRMGQCEKDLGGCSPDPDDAARCGHCHAPMNAGSARRRPEPRSPSELTGRGSAPGSGSASRPRGAGCSGTTLPAGAVGRASASCACRLLANVVGVDRQRGHVGLVAEPLRDLHVVRPGAQTQYRVRVPEVVEQVGCGGRPRRPGPAGSRTRRASPGRPAATSCRFRSVPPRAATQAAFRP